jgi:hypothetical protein
VPPPGDLPAAKGFIGVAPPGMQLSAFRRKPVKCLEFCVVGVHGHGATTSVELGSPIAGACETGLFGGKVAGERRNDGTAF